MTIEMQALETLATLSASDLEREEDRILDRLRSIRALLAARRRMERQRAEPSADVRLRFQTLPTA